MRLRVLDTFLDPGRRRRARRAAEAFQDPEERAAAERVYFFIDRVTGVHPDDVDLDEALGPIITSRHGDPLFWLKLENDVGRDDPRRAHVIENLRNGSVRHLIQHLCICRDCRRRFSIGLVKEVRPQAAPGRQ